MKASGIEVKVLDFGVVRKALFSASQILPTEHYEPLRQVVESHENLLELLRTKEASIRKLREMLFGASTEHLHNLTGKPSGQGAGGTKKKPRNHGRNGADAYPGAEQIPFQHSTLKHGDECPECKRANLYDPSRDLVVIRFFGQQPVTAKVWKGKCLRCAGCGKVFHPELPPEAQGDKYDATAVAVVALEKYGQGMGFSRLDKFQESLGVPLPASTQWDLVKKYSEHLEPVYQELLGQAAVAELFHNDDTPNRILELDEKKDAAKVGDSSGETGAAAADTNTQVVAPFSMPDAGSAAVLPAQDPLPVENALPAQNAAQAATPAIVLAPFSMPDAGSAAVLPAQDPLPVENALPAQNAAQAATPAIVLAPSSMPDAVSAAVLPAQDTLPAEHPAPAATPATVVAQPPPPVASEPGSPSGPARSAEQPLSAQAPKRERAKRTGQFTSTIVAVLGSRVIGLFFTGRNHAGENLAEVLKRRADTLGPPLQMCDGLARNLPAAFQTLLGNCLAHGRRPFFDLFAYWPEECRYVLEALAEVYQTDAQAKERGLSAEERLKLHQAHSGPVMARLKTWMEEQFQERKVEPNSRLGKAINYVLKRWDRLTLFLRKAGAPLDNNVAERALKMAIRHRKNSLFFKTLRGAAVADLFMSLIYTCQLNAVNPFEYLVALLRHPAELKAHPADWMPWTYRQTLARLAPGPGHTIAKPDGGTG